MTATTRDDDGRHGRDGRIVRIGRNGHDGRGRGDDRDGRSGDDRAELARLLPPATGFDLPPGRHEHHRERLMNQIDHDTADASASASVRDRAPARPRLLRPSFLAPVTALALAGALVAGYTAQSGGEGPGRAGGGTSSASERAGDAQPVALVLNRISDAAAKSDAVSVRDDQFLYSRSKMQHGDFTTGKLVTTPLEEVESWSSQKPGPQMKLGLVRQGGSTSTVNAHLGDTEGTAPGIGRPTYRWMATLPTDPRELLAHITALTPEREGQEHDQAVFDEIGGMLGGVAPPGTAAALYKAAALIPGVVEAPDAVDAIGRKGIGIARVDAQYSWRSEWIFDPETLAYLGSRSFLAADTEMGKKGELLGADALIESAVVDEEGVRPQD
ncbi:CU044_5270 family protein [Streptomyces sp. bgisy029]|uniref:CU044_5270 family protein n=1 Tax=Streptomyces sp. bgisy029 TaxID=3413771 RepID=UPI003D7339B4